MAQFWPLSALMKPENQYYRAFLQRYAHFVLLRAQMFGGMFTEIAPREISSSSKSSRSSRKSQKASTSPITSVALRKEHLDAAKMLLKTGCACILKNGEDCELTASCAERVALDMTALTTAVAVALNRALKGKESTNADPEIVKSWCEFYAQELLPKTKSMLKKSSVTLDSYGIFLPSRMGAVVSQSLLDIGLRGKEEEEEEVADDSVGTEAMSENNEEKAKEAVSAEATKVEDEKEEINDEQSDDKEEEEPESQTAKRAADTDEEFEDEYEYDEYEYDEE